MPDAEVTIITRKKGDFITAINNAAYSDDKVIIKCGTLLVTFPALPPKTDHWYGVCRDFRKKSLLNLVRKIGRTPASMWRDKAAKKNRIKSKLPSEPIR
jgi:hypothetical protein